MFAGTYTAMVTPFDRNEAVDYEAFGRLIDAQFAAGVDGIVPVGTTGESPTLTMAEHVRVIEFSVERTAGRGKVIAGTGANATAEAVELTRHAQAAGADGSLQVTPYYNKPSQAGLIKHFEMLADIGLPLVLYNIPGRTSRELTVDTVVTLAHHPHITTIKEAGGDVDRVSRYVDQCDIEIVSGDDSLTLPMMAVGAVGVISVVANVVPDRVQAMVQAALQGQWEAARQAHQALYPLFRDLFVETNPVPVKAALALLGRVEEVYRLPLHPLSEAQRAQVTNALQRVGLL